MKTKLTLLIATFVALIGASAANATTTNFISSGTFTWTAPAGVTAVTVQTWGGGGKGGTRTNQYTGGGGGGGAYSMKNSVSVTPGTGYTVVVGAGATNTAAGGDSYFINTSTVLAKGGSSVANNTVTGAAGGATASGIGDTKYSGGTGANANNTSGTTYGGGGGSSAGTATNGNTATSATGATAPTGGGDGGDGFSTASTTGDGSAGSAPGGGGGGGKDFTGGTGNGGAGADGQVVITYKLPATVTLSGLTQTYTGSALTPTATTVPAGLTIVWTSAPQTAAGTYAVTATINDPDYSGSASGGFVIQKATPTVSTWPTAGGIGLGQALSASTLSGGSASVAGAVAFASPSTVPSAAGTYTAAVTFTPTDTTDYNTVSGTANVAVSAWKYRKIITIDHTKVANTDQTNFPVLINLASDADLKNNAQSNGNDIRFTASDGTTVLSYERELYTSSTGAMVAWVKVPVLSHTTDTVLYMYYGNRSASDQQNKTNVWDANYQGVWHLNQTPSSTKPDMLDSTAGANNGTSQGSTFPTQVAGQIDGSLTFASASSNYISTANSFALTTNNSETVQVWIKTTTTLSNKVVGFEEAQTGTGATYADRQIYLDATGKARFGAWDTSGNNADMAVSTNKVNDGSWHSLVGVRDNSTSKAYLYVDGVLQATTNSTSGQSYTGYWRIGSYHITASQWFGANGYFSGSVDEVRVSQNARSADWIATEYKNESTSSSFYSVGTAIPNTTTTVSSTANPALPGASVAFTATVSSSAGPPTGTVQFKTNGTAFGDPAALSSGTAVSTTVTTLPHGSNAITAEYSGDVNFVVSTGAVSQVINLPPWPGMQYLATTVSAPLSASASTLASLNYDPDGDTLTIIAVSGTSTNGPSGNVTLSGGNVNYTPATGYVGADQFTYTVSDGYGGTATCTNKVTVRLGGATSAFNYISDSSGNVNLRGYGIPGKSYDVQRSGDPGFSSYTVIATVTAASGSGLILYRDTGAPSPSYYRFAVH